MLKERSDSLFYKLIWHTAWLFYPRIDIEGSLPKEPSIVVGNHSQTHGPIFSELYFPGKRFIWCAGQMMDFREVPDYAYQDFWNSKPAWSKPLYRLLSYIIALPAAAIMRHGDTIPVYRDSRVISTFRETVKRLCEGYHIIIFPEQLKPYNQILCQFQENFVDVAKLYYKKTGKTLSFIPMYLAPRLRKAYFGTPIPFNPENSIAQERTRITEQLMDEITKIAVSLPEHTVVPYANISSRFYTTNHSTEAIIHEKTGR